MTPMSASWVPREDPQTSSMRPWETLSVAQRERNCLFWPHLMANIDPPVKDQILASSTCVPVHFQSEPCCS